MNNLRRIRFDALEALAITTGRAVVLIAAAYLFFHFVGARS